MSTSSSKAEPRASRRRYRTARSDPVGALLSCGVGYSLLYVIENDVIAARRCEGYRRMSQAVSELSARGSPARPFLTATVPVSSGLMVAFGIGVAKTAAGSAALRRTGWLLVGGGVMGALWLPFPMSSREEIAEGGGGANDVGHLVLSAATAVVVLSQMGTGAAALGRAFRAYSVLSAVTFLGFGALTAVESPKLARGEATPHLGLVERVMLGAWLLWMAVLAVALRRAPARSGAPERTGRTTWFARLGVSRLSQARETDAGRIGGQHRGRS